MDVATLSLWFSIFSCIRITWRNTERQVAGSARRVLIHSRLGLAQEIALLKSSKVTLEQGAEQGPPLNSPQPMVGG